MMMMKSSETKTIRAEFIAACKLISCKLIHVISFASKIIYVVHSSILRSRFIFYIHSLKAN